MICKKSNTRSKSYVSQAAIMVTLGFLLASMTLSIAPSPVHDAYAAPTSKKVESHFDSGEWSYLIFDPVCGVEGTFTVNVDIRKYHFVLYEDGSYGESFNVHSDIIDEVGTLIASSTLTSKYFTGNTSYFPLESRVNYTLKCSSHSAEAGQTTSEHTRLIVDEDGSVVVSKGY